MSRQSSFTSFTADRSHLAILRLILPTDRSQKSAPTEVHLRANSPGQNVWEVYGLALFTAFFWIIWSWDALKHGCDLHAWYWQILLAPVGFLLGLILLHLANFLWIVISNITLRLGYSLERERSGVHHFLQTFGTSLLTLNAIRQDWAVSAALGWLWLALVAVNLLAFAWCHGGWKLICFTLPQLLGVALLTGSGESVITGILIIFATHMVLLYSVLHPTNRILGRSLERFVPNGREVCLTIDDGPAEDTESILQLLAEFEAKAVFFVIGDRAEAQSEDLTAIVEAGHLIGNHTMRHRQSWFWALSPAAIEKEVVEAQDVLQKLTGSRPRLFRSPVGFKNPFLYRILEQEQLHFISWNARGFDGVHRTVESSMKRLTETIQPGSTVLLHQGRPHSLALLRALLTWLQSEGYRCVLPPELLNFLDLKADHASINVNPQ